jgi:hypothetical protein
VAKNRKQPGTNRGNIMAEELGKIEKPSAGGFKKGRKLFFIPLIYAGKESPTDYLEKLEKYWVQVEEQISDLELKLGRVNRIYHELISPNGKEGLKALRELNEKSYQVAEKRVEKGSQLEATEDADLLTEFMDWSRCLSVGLQNQKVVTKVYEAYTEVSKKRKEFIARHLDETLKPDEIGLLFMREGHQIQFPSGVEVFYVAPPAFDEINRWLRDREAQLFQNHSSNTENKEGN